jgi:cytochrome c biogenesis protein CcdA
MAATFAAVATLAAVGGGWAVQANEYGRYAALALLALFGITLLFPALADMSTRPVVALGSRLSETADRRAGTSGSSVLPSLLLGVATGLLWAPCAGPVLGLILTGAAWRERISKPRCCWSPMPRAPQHRWRWHWSSAAESLLR